MLTLIRISMLALLTGAISSPSASADATIAGHNSHIKVPKGPTNPFIDAEDLKFWEDLETALIIATELDPGLIEEIDEAMDDDASWVMVDRENTTAWGIADRDTIAIDPGMPIESMAVTIIHEGTHLVRARAAEEQSDPETTSSGGLAYHEMVCNHAAMAVTDAWTLCDLWSETGLWVPRCAEVTALTKLAKGHVEYCARVMAEAGLAYTPPTLPNPGNCDCWGPV